MSNQEQGYVCMHILSVQRDLLVVKNEDVEKSVCK